MLNYLDKEVCAERTTQSVVFNITLNAHSISPDFSGRFVSTKVSELLTLEKI